MSAGRLARVIVVVAAMVTVWLGACERSSTQVQGPSGPKQEPTYEDLGMRLFQLNRQIESEPENVDALLERADVERRLAEFETGDRKWELYQAAWDDFRTVHELSGGKWDFPNVLDTLRAAQEGEPSPRPPAAGGQRESGSVKALLGAARLCGRLYQHELASRLVQRAAELDPNDPSVWPRIITLRAVADGNWERARNELKKLADHPVLKNAEYYWFALGSASHQAGNLEEAEQAYRRAMELSDEPWAARSNLIVVLGEMGKYEEQATLAQQATSVNLNDLYAQNNYGADLIGAGRYAEAVAILQPLMDRNPGFPMGWLNLGRAYRGLREYERAISAFRNALRLVPQSLDGWRFLAFVYAETGRVGDALAAYEKFWERIAPKATDYCEYAQLLWQLQLRQEAEENFRQALQLEPDHAQAWRALGRLLLEEKRHSEARAAALRAVEADPNSVSALRLMGDAEMAADQPEAAADWYRKVLAIQPDDQPVFWSLCVALLKASRSAEALELIERELERRPQTPALYSCRATVRFARGELAEAEADYTRATDLRPSSEGLRMRGLIRLLRGEAQAATEDLHRSFQIGPSDGYTALLLWVVERDAGHVEAADTVLCKARAQVDPNTWTGRLLRSVTGELSADELLSAAEDDSRRCEAYYYLGEQARALGQAAAAREWFEKCAATGKTSLAEYRLATWRLERQ